MFAFLTLVCHKNSSTTINSYDYELLFKHKIHKGGLLLHPFDTGPSSFEISLNFRQNSVDKPLWVNGHFTSINRGAWHSQCTIPSGLAPTKG